ncbi:MAG: hypothetical protein KAI47_10880 [Deltaproteobacteria bacterium]|nr:hypothetical protein [Deltaproteobacteria bacterium]
MRLISCENCCFNALQYDNVGLSFGYCTEHRCVLNTPSRLTCGRHFRKDLLLASAQQEAKQHSAHYSPAFVALVDGSRANGSTTTTSPKDVAQLKKDPVANIVVEYGRIGTKILSLSQLRMLRGGRAEIALLSLARSYVRRCVQNGGAWTSGVHVSWWTKNRLAEEPSFEVSDLRVETALPVRRQIDLAKWSTVMMRLVFLSDLGKYASNDRSRVKSLASLPEEAVIATGSLSPRRLLAWVKRHALPKFEWALSEQSYARLCDNLHQDT